MMLEQLDSNVQKKKKKKTEDLTLFTKLNSKWITDLDVKCETIKLLEDNIGENRDDLGYGDDFFFFFFFKSSFYCLFKTS